MRCKILGLVCLLFFFASVQSQTMKQIKESGRYLWGFGESKSHSKASSAALYDLVSKISVEVQASFTHIVEEADGEIKDYSQSIINTYSGTTLKGAETIEVEKDNQYRVLRFIERTNLDKIFEDRQRKILDYVEVGLKAESEFRIADALKNYYWALLLLRTHPENETLKSHMNYMGEVSLLTALPDMISSILTRISFTTREINHKENEDYKLITFDIKLEGNKVQNIEYKYNHGGGRWSLMQSARNGIGTAQLYGDAASVLENIDLKIEYAFEDKANVDSEILAIVNESNLDKPYYNVCKCKIPLVIAPSYDTILPKLNEIVETEKIFVDTLKPNSLAVNVKDLLPNELLAVITNADSLGVVTELIITDKDSIVNDLTIKKNTVIRKKISDIIEAIKTKKYNSVDSLFDDTGLRAFKELIAYGKAEIISHPDPLKVIRVGYETLVRSVPMLFSFPNSRRQFIENVVFIMDTTQKVCDVNFALSDIAVEDITKKSNRFGSDKEKYFLLRFMENYKTAYCLKRIDYIEKIFDEDALIIVGREVRKFESPDSQSLRAFGGKKFEYVRKSKKEYIESLKTVFRNNKFVNIHFEDNNVKRANENSSIYGIQISQYYTSDSYADKGYLFLMVDLRDTLNPTVYVRTWQPDKDENGKIFDINDFTGASDI